tara:strand:+ start:900 stop:2588 length:1689 start_codon:yes stop_codon:yes gene_type:complete
MTLTKIASTGVEDSLRWVLGANGTSDYTFTGPGLTGTVNDPTIYLTRGQTYIFQNNSGGHPFYIKTSIANGGTNDAYNTGVTNNGGGNGTEIVFTVPHDSPDILYYQCSSHASMAGQFNIAGSVADGSISTAKLADDAVTQAKLANNAVTTAEINNLAVTTAKLNDAAVTTAKISDNAVTTQKIANNAVTNAKVASGAISSATIIDANVTEAKIADDAVTTQKIAANAITTNRIADQAVTLAKLPHGTSSNDGKFLRANNGADPTFETVTSTTIGGNANNRIITGSDTANTLAAEADVTYDAATSDFSILGSKPGTSMDLIVQNNGGGNAAGARVTIQSGSAANTGPQFGLICGSKTWYLQTPKNVGALDFHGNGTRTFRLLEDGHVEIANGDLTLGTNGHGIDFYGGSGSYRQAANTLDDYEEGTFTPNIQDAASGGNSHGNSGVREAKYTKIGNTVTVMMNCRSLSNSGLNGSHQLFVTNLPFRQSGVERAVTWAQVQYFNNVSNTEFGMHFQINANETIMRFHKMKDNQGANPAVTFNHWMYSNGYYGFSTTFTYITDQ